MSTGIVATAVFAAFLSTSCILRSNNEESETFAKTYDSVVTLMYHEVRGEKQANSNGTPWDSSSSDVWATNFEKHLKYLKEQGYTTISTQELYESYANKKPLPAKAAHISFDDNYIGNYAYAAPLLRKYGMKATFFVVSGTMGVMAGKPTRCGQITSRDHFTWVQAKELDDDPLFEIESHSHCHPLSPNALNDISDEEMRREIVTSKEFIKKHIGRDPIAFAYPQGRHGRREIRLIRDEKHYRLAFVVQKVPPNLDPIFQIRRLELGTKNEDIESFKYAVDNWFYATK